jgi:hypothetical protein
MSDENRPEGYEPPRVDELPTGDRPAVTAAGNTPPPLAAEWRRAEGDADTEEDPRDHVR